MFLYKRVQTKQQTVDRNVFAWPSCNGQAIASWTLSFHLVLVHFELYCLLLLTLPYFSSPSASPPPSGGGDALGQACRASVDNPTNQLRATAGAAVIETDLLKPKSGQGEPVQWLGLHGLMDNLGTFNMLLPGLPPGIQVHPARQAKLLFSRSPALIFQDTANLRLCRQVFRIFSSTVFLFKTGINYTWLDSVSTIHRSMVG